MTYIEPRYQLPRYAVSLGTPTERLMNALATIGNALAEALVPAFAAIAEIIEYVVEEYQDATRDNAYRPQGKVIRSTAFPMPDGDVNHRQGLLE